MKPTAMFILACLVSVVAQDLAPHRVFDAARAAFGEFDPMIDDLAAADVVFVGEQHDSANTHRLELALLQAIGRRRGDVVLSLEMFERDVQEPLDHFLMGHAAEDEFMKDARAWPRYRTDYKPLVDFAIAKEWQVVAANVPRSIASEVSKGGLEVLQAKSAADRRLFAADLQCPTDDEYFKRFGEAMGDHSGTTGTTGTTGTGGTTGTAGTTTRFYYAQCLKDETMAESIAQAYTIAALGGKRPLVVHINGAFHSDFGQGTAARARRRLPGKRVVVVSMLPVEKMDVQTPDAAERRRGDFLVYTVAGKN
jgi:uncharacterized iron-regulated protein